MLILFTIAPTPHRKELPNDLFVDTESKKVGKQKPRSNSMETLMEPRQFPQQNSLEKSQTNMMNDRAQNRKPLLQKRTSAEELKPKKIRACELGPLPWLTTALRTESSLLVSNWVIPQFIF